MSNEVILNLSFDNQTVTDLTGNWILDGTPNATYEQIDGRDGYSIVEGSLGRCIVLNAVDQNARYDEYTVDFDMFVKSTYTSDYYIYNVFYLWSQKNPKIRGSFDGKIGEVLSIAPRIGSSSPVGVTRYSPIGRWVHVTITSGPTGEENLYHTAVYVDGVKLTERTESGTSYDGNPFGISQRIIPCARDPGSFLMPNGPGVCLNTYKIVAGIHAPNQEPAISLLNLSRVFNNFCTWLKRQLSTVAFTGSYNDLSNKPTISTVNDATLTIQQNGTTVDSFSANSSTNKTVNIQCVDLSTAQTVGGVKTFTSNMVIQGGKKVICNLDNSYIELDGGTAWGKGGSIVLSGQDRSSYNNSVLIVSKSDTNTDILQYQNGELKPLWNNTSNSSLGTSTNQWKSVYSQTYYYNGTDWGLDKANTWTDTNTFSKTNSDTIQLKNGRVAIGETISSDTFTQFSFKDKNTDNLAYIRNSYIANGTNNLDFYVRNKYSSGSPSTTGSVVYTYFGLSLDNTGKSYARLKGDFYPYTDNLYSLGTSTNKWSKVYSDDVVHTTGNETIGGVKTFSQETTMFGRDINLMSRLHYGKNSNPSAASWHYLFFRGNTATEGYTDSWYSGFLEQLLNTNGSARGRWLIRDTSENSVCLELSVNGSDKQVRPQENNTIDLGTSTNKWKSFNGINPGALSYPNKSSYINIDTTNWDLTCSNQGIIANYTAEESGWLLLQIRHGTADIVDLWLVTDSIRMNNKSTLNMLDNRNFNMISLPVVKGETLRIFGDASQYVAGRVIDYARIYRGLGQ